MAVVLVLNFIVPFVMILVGMILKKHPVSDMSTHNGYNTPVSRKSKEHWDYAQSIAPGIFLRDGAILALTEAVMSIVLTLLGASAVKSVIIGVCIGFASLLFGFYQTDGKIEEKFNMQQKGK